MVCHSGQYVFVVPSAGLVVVRLGLSIRNDGKDGAVELAGEAIRVLAPEAAVDAAITPTR